MKGVTMNKKITALICALPSCSMAYMTTKTPLDADSWEYRGAYFYNSGPSPSAFVEMTGNDEYSVKSTSFEKDSEVLR